MMPLSMAAANSPAPIVKVGGRGAQRLFIENLGFVPGAPVTVLSKNGDGLIVNIKGTRIAINKDIALKIYI